MQNVHFIAPILCRRIIGDVMKAIEIENLSKAYPLYASKKDKFKEAVLPGNRKYHKDFYALRNVSFEVEKGECV